MAQNVFATFIRGFLSKKGLEEAVDFREHVIPFIEGCIVRDLGVPQLRTKYAGKRFPENLVLGVCYGGGKGGGMWFKGVPEDDLKYMEKHSDDWQYLWGKYAAGKPRPTRSATAIAGAVEEVTEEQNAQQEAKVVQDTQYERVAHTWLAFGEEHKATVVERTQIPAEWAGLTYGEILKEMEDGLKDAGANAEAARSAQLELAATILAVGEENNIQPVGSATIVGGQTEEEIRATLRELPVPPPLTTAETEEAKEALAALQELPFVPPEEPEVPPEPETIAPEFADLPGLLIEEPMEPEAFGREMIRLKRREQRLLEAARESAQRVLELEAEEREIDEEIELFKKEWAAENLVQKALDQVLGKIEQAEENVERLSEGPPSDVDVQQTEAEIKAFPIRATQVRNLTFTELVERLFRYGRIANNIVFLLTRRATVLSAFDLERLTRELITIQGLLTTAWEEAQKRIVRYEDMDYEDLVSLRKLLGYLRQVSSKAVEQADIQLQQDELAKEQGKVGLREPAILDLQELVVRNSELLDEVDSLVPLVNIEADLRHIERDELHEEYGRVRELKQEIAERYGEALEEKKFPPCKKIEVSPTDAASLSAWIFDRLVNLPSGYEPFELRSFYKLLQKRSTEGAFEYPVGVKLRPRFAKRLLMWLDYESIRNTTYSDNAKRVADQIRAGCRFKPIEIPRKPLPLYTLYVLTPDASLAHVGTTFTLGEALAKAARDFRFIPRKQLAYMTLVTPYNGIDWVKTLHLPEYWEKHENLRRYWKRRT